jgi:hypothetical protein
MASGAMAQRVVGAETLDGLDESDPAAQRSRADLRRIHVAMGTRAIIRRALNGMIDDGNPTDLDLDVRSAAPHPRTGRRRRPPDARGRPLGFSGAGLVSSWCCSTGSR